MYTCNNVHVYSCIYMMYMYMYMYVISLSWRRHFVITDFVPSDFFSLFFLVYSLTTCMWLAMRVHVILHVYMYIHVHAIMQCTCTCTCTCTYRLATGVVRTRCRALCVETAPTSTRTSWPPTEWM